MARGQNCMLQSEIHIHVDTHMHALILAHTHKTIVKKCALTVTTVVTSQK